LKNFFFVLGFGLSVGDVIMGACLRDFVTGVTWPWAPTQRAIFWNLGYHTSLKKTGFSIRFDKSTRM